MNPRKVFDIVAFDMDGVLVDYPSSWTWIHKHFGVENETALQAYLRDEIDDLEFMKRDIALWKDRIERLSIDELRDILSQIPLSRGIMETVMTLKERGIKTVIVSGGLDIVAERLKNEFGFDDYIANGVKCDENGFLTGEGILRVKLKNKNHALESILEKFAVSRRRAVCIGNSSVDVSMFRGCGLSIAFNPVDDVVARNAHLTIVSKDLRSILPYIIDVHYSL
ncbi:MAG: HAD-IB family phosphatase [Methanomassiliicoccales archaeon]